MKTKISTILATAAIMFGAASCSESWNPVPGAEQGSLSMLSMGVTVNKAAPVQSRADGVDLSQFKVSVVSLSDNSVAGEYLYGTMPEIITLPVGAYRVDVESHSVQKAEFDRPYYKGVSKDFEIRNNELTEIGNVVCNLSNVKVTIAYTDALKAIMGDDVTVTVEANDDGRLVFTPAETRSGYFAYVDGSMTMVANFAGTVGGAYTEARKQFSDVAAGKHYIVTFDVKNAPVPPTQTGQVDPSGITVDGSVTEEDVTGGVSGGDEETIEPGTRPGTEEGGEEPGPGPDEPGPGPVDPGAEAATFVSETIDLEGVNDARTWGDKEAVVVINCPEGFAKLEVFIDSEGLTPDVLGDVGLADYFDLANPDPELVDGLEGLGFPVGAEVVGKTEVNFDITQFVPMLTIYSGSSDFKIVVTDAKGNKSEKTLKFIS